MQKFYKQVLLQIERETDREKKRERGRETGRLRGEAYTVNFLPVRHRMKKPFRNRYK